MKHASPGTILLALSIGCAAPDQRDDTPPDIHYDSTAAVRIPDDVRDRFVVATTDACGPGCEVDVAAHRVALGLDAESVVLAIAGESDIELERLVHDRADGQSPIATVAELARVRAALGSTTPDDLVFATGRSGGWLVHLAAELHRERSLVIVHHVAFTEGWRHGSRDIHN